MIFLKALLLFGEDRPSCVILSEVKNLVIDSHAQTKDVPFINSHNREHEVSGSQILRFAQNDAYG
jgi:hypothetical protein